jgi:hypothetical protein
MDPGDIYMNAFDKALLKADAYAKSKGYDGITVITEGSRDAAAKRIIFLWYRSKFKEIGATYPYSGSFIQLADESVTKINIEVIYKRMLEELQCFIDHS